MIAEKKHAKTHRRRKKTIYLRDSTLNSSTPPKLANVCVLVQIFFMRSVDLDGLRKKKNRICKYVPKTFMDIQTTKSYGKPLSMNKSSFEYIYIKMCTHKQRARQI